MTFWASKGADPCRPRHFAKPMSHQNDVFVIQGCEALSTSHARNPTAPKPSVKHYYTWLCRVRCPLAQMALDIPRPVPHGTKTKCQTLLHMAVPSPVSPGSKDPRRPTLGAPRHQNQLSNTLTHGYVESGVPWLEGPSTSHAWSPTAPKSNVKRSYTWLCRVRCLRKIGSSECAGKQPPLPPNVNVGKGRKARVEATVKK